VFCSVVCVCVCVHVAAWEGTTTTDCTRAPKGDKDILRGDETRQ